MTEFDDDTRDKVELEVRRILSSEEINFRSTLSTEASEYREFLQRQFRQITLGVSALAAVGAALFVWFFSDSVERTQTQLEATVDAKLIDYRIVESFRTRVNEIVDIEASSDRTAGIIKAQVVEQVGSTVSEQADDIISNAVAEQISDVQKLDAEAILRRAALPAGTVEQVQAQATCSAISFSNQSFGRYVRAVVRPQIKSTGEPATGNGDAITCTQICSGLDAPTSGREQGVCFAAVHIYDRFKPLAFADADFTEVSENSRILTRTPASGLMTHVYAPTNGCNHTHFGPNFCCCSN